jgi:hypothetical protein
VDQAIGHALALAGIAATGAAWWMVAWRGILIWRVMPPVLVALGVATVLWGDVVLVGTPVIAASAGLDRSAAFAASIGVLVGAALFVGTRIAFVPLAHWGRFAEDARREYEPAAARSRATVLLLAFVSATCEELFWRGWTQPELLASNAGVIAAALAASWLAYVAANALSRSLVIVTGAVVGGAVWVVLQAVTGGVAAPLACHVVWTLAMLVLPPRIPPRTQGSMMSA